MQELMRSDDASASRPSPPGSIPRHELWNSRAPLQSAPQQVQGVDDVALYDERPLEHNKCQSNTPDGRLYLCGEAYNSVRYFKFESLKFSAEGVPEFTDAPWSLWPDRWANGAAFRNTNKAVFCFPDWKKPFDVLPDGSHLYRTFLMSHNNRFALNVTVANPMTTDAEIAGVSIGPREPFTRHIPKYAYFTTDGRMVVGSRKHGNQVDPKASDREATYSALPADAEPCGLDWPEMRYLHELPSDPDGLNLPARYPFARQPFRDAFGNPFTEENPIYGAYMWMDNDARNLWYGAGRSWRVMGEDTSGIEFIMEGGINKFADERDRYMSSPLWNFESERTANQRYPGELHTSGVGSGCPYQLPMSKAHHVLPVFTAHQQFYTETELFNVWKSPHWDIFYLPMSAIYLWYDGVADNARFYGNYTPDLSRNFMTGVMYGDAQLDWDATEEPLDTPQGVGTSMRFGTAGAVVVDLPATAADVPAVSTPVKAFTAQLAFETFWMGQHGNRWLINHPNISLIFGRGRVQWTLMGMILDGGPYVSTNEWRHVAVVFDGVDQTVTTYNNGIEVATVATSFQTFQLGNAVPLILGNSVYGTGIDWSSAEGLNGRIDSVRFMAHARSQRNICKSAFGSNCGDAISYHPTTSQFELGMQIKECTASTMHTIACYAATHRVCANIDAKLMKDMGTSNDALGALTPPGPPVSMGGVPVALYGTSVAVACTPNHNHLSVPVDWHVMERYNSGCTHMTDRSSVALYCNLAAHAFCKDAFTSIDADTATGVLFEADARAWVTCFEASRAITIELDTLTACSDIESFECQVEAAGHCDSEDGGLVQDVTEANVTLHCFDGPPHLRLHNFTL